jgi:hypothetical protein
MAWVRVNWNISPPCMNIGGMFYSPVEWSCESLIGEGKGDKIKYLHCSTKLNMVEGAGATD